MNFTADIRYFGSKLGSRSLIVDSWYLGPFCLQEHCLEVPLLGLVPTLDEETLTTDDGKGLDWYLIDMGNFKALVYWNFVLVFSKDTT